MIYKKKVKDEKHRREISFIKCFRYDPSHPRFFSLSVVVPAADSLHLVHSPTDRAILFNTLGNVSSLL